MQETIGKRIARLRQLHGWTQQDLANRLAISRVAISHIEMDLTLPGERTITLLAGLFKIPPHLLVEDSDYPPAKRDRLPPVACSYTQLELELSLMDKDLEWLEVFASLGTQEAISLLRAETLARWAARLDAWSEQWMDSREQSLLTQACRRLNQENEKG